MKNGLVRTSSIPATKQSLRLFSKTLAVTAMMGVRAMASLTSHAGMG